MTNGMQAGVHAFLRAYTITRAPIGCNNRIASRLDAEELAKMPTYYIGSQRDDAETVAHEMHPRRDAACTGCRTTSFVYAGEYEAQWFPGVAVVSRARRARYAELQLFAGKHRRASMSSPVQCWGHISAWCVRQCTGCVHADMVGCHLLEAAGHWVQQEQARRSANAGQSCGTVALDAEGPYESPRFQIRTDQWQQNAS